MMIRRLRSLSTLPVAAALLAMAAVVALALVAAGSSGGAPSASAAPHESYVAAKAAAKRKPNVVFVLTDDLSRNLVRYMPHVKAMERRGATFSRYIVTDSLCCPSRSTIFTGRFPHNTKVFTNRSPDGGFDVFHARGEEKSTFATALQKAGYRTAMMGKYLNGYQTRYSPGAKHGYVPPGWNEWDVADNGYPEFNFDLNQNGTVHHYSGRTNAHYLTNVVAGKGVGFIRRNVSAKRPFMLEIATFAPHGPYTPAPRDAHKFPGLKAPRGPAFDHQNANPPSWLHQRALLTAGQIHRIDTGYRKRAQAVQAVDRMIGRLEAALGKQRDNTYLVFSSDNGYHMGQHRLMPGKQTAFDTDIRVPLVVVGPGVRHRTIDQIAQNTDLRPTFQQIGHAHTPANVDGRSMLDLLHGHRAPRDWRSAALIEHHGPDLLPSDPDHPNKGSGNPTTYEALRNPNGVYVEYRTGEREYYDLRKDPYELVNTVSQLSKRRLAYLHARLVQLERCHGEASCRAAAR